VENRTPVQKRLQKGIYMLRIQLVKLNRYKPNCAKLKPTKV